jgi:hypothetical protein
MLISTGFTELSGCGGCTIPEVYAGFGAAAGLGVGATGAVAGLTVVGAAVVLCTGLLTTLLA